MNDILSPAALKQLERITKNYRVSRMQREIAKSRIEGHSIAVETRQKLLEKLS